MVHAVRRFGNGLTLILGLGAVLLGACGAPPPCTSSALCRGGMVCGATGSCAPLDPDAARFSRSVWLSAEDWGATARNRLGRGPLVDTDVLFLGGPRQRRFHVSFGPLPEGGTIAGAVLVLSPHRTWTPPAEGAELSVFVTRPFLGTDLTRSEAPRRAAMPAASAALAPGATRILRMDLTEEIAAARERGATRVFLAIAGQAHRGDAPPLRFASPRSLRPDDRPRLELSVR